MLEKLKLKLKKKLSHDRLGELFNELETVVIRTESNLYNDLILIKSQWTISRNQEMRGTIDIRDKTLSFNSINQALLWLIGQIEMEDLAPQTRRPIEEYRYIASDFRFTCDRVQQNDDFQLTYYDPPEKVLQKSNGKIHFFYLHGDLKQEHSSLVERFGKQLGGLMLDFEEGNYNPEREPIFVHCKPQASRNPKVLRIFTLKELMSKFELRVQPIDKRTISDLLASRRLTDKTSADSIFILFTIDDHNWHPEIIPELIRSLYEDFCGAELEGDVPTFFFFFGMEYQKENTRVQQEIEAAIGEAKYGTGLKKLEAVSISDVAEWISRIKPALPMGTDPIQLAEKWFPGQSSIDMADVLIKLKQFIDQHNSRLIFDDE